MHAWIIEYFQTTKSERIIFFQLCRCFRSELEMQRDMGCVLISPYLLVYFLRAAPCLLALAIIPHFKAASVSWHALFYRLETQLTFQRFVAFAVNEYQLCSSLKRVLFLQFESRSWVTINYCDQFPTLFVNCFIHLRFKTASHRILFAISNWLNSILINKGSGVGKGFFTLVIYCF